MSNSPEKQRFAGWLCDYSSVSQSHPTSIFSIFTNIFLFCSIQKKDLNMPRTYTRQLGARSYRNYSDDQIEGAVNLILSTKLSLRQASSRFNIHRNSLWLKTKEKRGLTDKLTRTPDGQSAFTSDEEKLFVAHTIALSVERISNYHARLKMCCQVLTWQVG